MKKAIFFFFLLAFCSAMYYSQVPALQWAVRAGYSGATNIGNGIAVDAQGNVYTAGSFSGTVDFDPGPGTANLSSLGNSDIYVCKLDASGAFVWARQMSGTNVEAANAIAVDASGNVYTTGFFSGTVDFDPGPGNFALSAIGGDDIFISKLTTTGAFAWAVQLGGGGPESANAIDVDASGNVYSTGFLQGGGDYDPGPGVFMLTPAGGADIYISKLNTSGTFVWAQRFGGSGATGAGRGIKTDAAGNVFIGGFFSGIVDFDPGAGVAQQFSAGSTDVFISKLTAAGTYVWAKAMGGTSTDFCAALSLDASGNIYSTGAFQNAADFDPGAGVFNLTATGPNDAFISKLDASGNFVWVKQIGSTGDEMGYSIKADASGNVYTTGYFQGTVDFDPGAGVFSMTSAGSDDIFISKLTSAGTFTWALQMGGTSSDVPKGIEVDGSGSVYTTGYFWGIADFDPGPNTYTLSPLGSVDIYTAKLCILPVAPVNNTPAQNQSICNGQTATLTANGSGTISWYASPTGTVVLAVGNTYTTQTLSTGTYTFYAEDETCFPSPARTAIVVTVNPQPVFSASTSSIIICNGETAILTITGVTSATWNPGALTGTSVPVSPTTTTGYTVTGYNGGCYVTSAITQLVSPCTGIDELEHSINGFSTFPNPVSGELTVQNNSGSGMTLHFYNSSGQLILEKTYGWQEKNVKLDASEYAAGLYYLQINADGKNYFLKVMVVNGRD